MRREQAADWSGILGGLLLLAGCGAFVAQRNWTPTVVGLLVAGALGIGVWLALTGPELAREAAGRRFLEGANIGLYTVIVLVILGFANYLGYKHNQTFDLTKEKLHTLADESVKAAQQFKDPVTVIGFYRSKQTTQRNEFEDLIRRYAAANPRISYRFVDADADPITVQKYNVSIAPTVVFETGGRKNSINDTTEEAVTNALLQLSGNEKTVCFLIGHGEHTPSDYQDQGYSDLGHDLLEKNYQTRTFEILKEQKVPDTCAVVTIAGPKGNLQEGELALLNQYLDHGGKLMIMLDPLSETNAGTILAPYGVTVKKELIIEPISALAQLNQTAPLIVQDGYNKEHPITKDLEFNTVFPISMPLWLAAPAPSGAILTWLLKTSPDSWGETDLSKSTAEYNPGVDSKGPLTLAVAIRKGDTRILAVGNSLFVANTFLKQIAQNEIFFVNGLRWLVGQESLISIPAKQRQNQPLTLTDSQMSEMVVFFWFILPGLFVLAGLAMWWRRRGL